VLLLRCIISKITSFPSVVIGNDGFYEVLAQKTQNPVSVKLY